MSRYIGICTILKCSPRLLEVFDRDTFVILHDLNLTLTSPGTDHSCEVDWVGGKIKDLRPEESDNHIEPIFGGVIFSFIKLIYLLQIIAKAKMIQQSGLSGDKIFQEALHIAKIKWKVTVTDVLYDLWIYGFLDH